jgi:hypothetical protein
MRARHEAIWNDRPTSRCKAGCVAVIGSGIRSTFYANFADVVPWIVFLWAAMRSNQRVA